MNYITTHFPVPLDEPCMNSWPLGSPFASECPSPLGKMFLKLSSDSLGVVDWLCQQMSLDPLVVDGQSDKATHLVRLFIFALWLLKISPPARDASVVGAVGQLCEPYCGTIIGSLAAVVCVLVAPARWTARPVVS